MKPTLPILLLLVFNVSAQTITFDNIMKAGDDLGEYGNKIGLFKEYIASNGEVFKVGESVILGEPTRYNDTYQHIFLTDNFSYEAFASSDEGFASEISRIKIQKARNGGYVILLIGYSGLGGKYWINIEAAIEKGEIKSNIMTRYKAIVKLKEAKDLLDLEVITKEEYDKLKEELKLIIRGGN